ncbi:alpha/beta superfamily hydrolase (macronuclear) [Tetrahymena thermophila SB210]|uniref:Alpha/beta superfamily hydrolase n=1 Tax=Tetrahymena thermophila (strain SB210) TaxID=312017 RepID=Q22D15_TETTS|nr:alpha/beta superfamily hydrolase [Tetrahymena thermophila SB210]EAR83174.1 alpha/beta superfamily hydrolase [Tetrahymena thermophila SB210]|eukprot:XP_001030837.1 alpha/beta superfamily hydrolase [Tetrahymena thermophila SB210]
MALCLFKCFSACGCRESIISKFAFYPQKPGYRFQEVDIIQSQSSTQTKHNIEKRFVKDRIEEFADHSHNIPRFYHLPSDDGKHYELILVYEEHEVLLNDQSSLSVFQNQYQNDSDKSQKNEQDQSKTGLTLVNQKKEVIHGKQYQLEIKEVFGENEQKQKSASSAAVKAAIKGSDSEEQKEESKSNMKNPKIKDKEKKINKFDKKEEPFRQVDDLYLICFKKKNRENNLVCGYHIENLKHRSEIVVIYSHGNSTDIGYMINQALDVSYNLRVNVIAYDYSGYGKSQGKPSEKSFIYDLEAIYKYALQIGYKSINIVFYGQSVGSGPSTFLASQKKFPIGGLIIHSGFTSGLRITQQQEQKMQKTYSKDFFPNIEFIRKVNAPIFIIHGTNDQDIKIHHASELYERAKKNYTPFFLEVKGAGHNDIEHEDKFRKDYFKELRRFMGHLRQNRNQVIQEFIQKQNILKQKRNSSIQVELKDIQGFAGDGQSESFNHIYYQYFTPINSVIEQTVKSLSIDKNTEKQQSSQSQNQISGNCTPSSRNKAMSNKTNKFNEEQIAEKNGENNPQSLGNIFQKGRDSTTLFEVETKIDRTEQHPPSGREDNLSDRHSQQDQAAIKNNDQAHQKIKEEEEDIQKNILQENQLNKNIANAFAQESDDDDDNDSDEAEDNVGQYVNNQKNFSQKKEDITIQQQENFEQVQEVQYDSLKDERIAIHIKNKSHSLTDQNNRQLFCSYRSQKSQQVIQNQNPLDNKLRNSQPNLNDQQIFAEKSFGNINKKRYIEDEKIRLHNVTSIIRKKQNSQFSAYILDHSSYSNHDNISESLNSSLLKPSNQQDKNNNSKHSFNKDTSSNSSKQAGVRQDKSSPKVSPRITNIDQIDRSNSIKYDQNHKQNQFQQQQKYNSYQVDSVKEEVQESQIMSSSLKESLIPAAKNLHNDQQLKQESHITVSREPTQQNNKTNPVYLLQQIFTNEKTDDLDYHQNVLENSGNQFQEVHYDYEENSGSLSGSDSSPHHSKSIKPVRSDEISIPDSDITKKKKEGSIKSKETLKSINSNY